MFEELLNDFPVSGVSIAPGYAAIPVLKIENEYASALVSPHGAHVMAYTPAGEKPLLWMSKKSEFSPGKTIRGGIPVCWPYFGPSADGGPAHGYARLAEWKIESVERGKFGHMLVFSLPAQAIPETFAGLRAKLTVRIGAALEVTLAMRNDGPEPRQVSCALHSYFAVCDVRRVSVSGLENTRYIDKVAGGEKVQQGAVTIAGEVDRVYLGTETACVIDDPASARKIRVAKRGSSSTVVWNPWVDKSKRISDFGDAEYPEMLCVEAVNAAEDARTLAPGEEHSLATLLSIE